MSRATTALPAPRAPRPRSAAPAAERAAQVLVRVHAGTGEEAGPHAPDALCRVALDALLDDVGGDGTVWLTDPVDGATLQAVAVRLADTAGLDELVHLTALHPPRLDQGAPARAVAALDGALLLGDPWLAEGAALPPRLRRWLDAHPTAHVLLLPLRYGDRVLGLLELVRRRPGRRFTGVDTAVARQVARHLATSLADAALQELERSTARRERVLAAVSRTVDEALRHPEDLLADVVRAVAEHLGAVVGVRLVGPAVDQLGPGAVHHPEPATAAALERFLLSERPGGFVDRCLSEGRRHVSAPQVGRLVATSVGLEPQRLQLTAAYGVRLQARGEPLGVLVAGRPSGVFALEERRLVDVVVDRLSLALDNAALLAATRTSARRHEAIVESSSDMLLVLDADGRASWASASTVRRARVRVGSGVLGMVLREDRHVVLADWERLRREPGTTTTSDVRIRLDDGSVRTVEATAKDLLADPAVRGVVVSMRDVTRERRAARALQVQARQQAVLAGIGSRALTATRLDDLFDHAVHAVNDVLGTGSTGLLELMPEGDLLLRAGTLKSAGVGTTRFPADTPYLRRVLEGAGAVAVEDYRLSAPEETPYADEHGVRSGVLLPVVVEGRVWGVLSCHDGVPRHFGQVELDFLQTACTVLAGAVHRGVVEGRVRHQATHDALTGLPNRTTLQAVLGRAVRSGGRPALLLLDLDDFKDVNDSLGHGAGDRVLAQLGERLRATVGDRGVVARLGGDEFAVCLDGPHAADRAVELATSLTAAVAEPFQLPGLDITLSVSTGIALAPDHGRDADRLLQHADLAMYRAKSTRQGWAVFDAELDRERSERLSLLVDLRDALATDQLELHYQPLVGLADGRVTELEALVRWHHPERGLLLPGVFVPLAEQTDLIDDLTLQVARRSAAQAQAWAGEGYDVRIACNVSPASLRDRRVVARLAQVVADAQGRLELEITESALVDEEARDAVARLVRSGATCAVDDFGTGYSALSYLRDLPVSRLKLDRSLSLDVDTDERAAALVSGIVQLAHDLRLAVVAEGVERVEVGQALAGLGVDVAQGWLYGRAAAPPALDRSAWRRR